jgi:hypothetical protein
MHWRHHALDVPRRQGSLDLGDAGGAGVLPGGIDRFPLLDRRENAAGCSATPVTLFVGKDVVKGLDKSEKIELTGKNARSHDLDYRHRGFTPTPTRCVQEHGPELLVEQLTRVHGTDGGDHREVSRP